MIFLDDVILHDSLNCMKCVEGNIEVLELARLLGRQLGGHP